MGGAGVWARFSATLRRERERIGSGSEILSSPYGPIEYAAVGQGTPVLAIHGAGGGFDQILYGAQRLLAAGYRVIAPSRFGYLRSANPADPTPEKQADAYIALLDALGVERAAVIGISVGAVSALQFAARHPDRCRSLTLIVPAAGVAGDTPQGALPKPDALSRLMIDYALKSDFVLWLSITLAPDQMIRSTLATDPALVAAASPEERRRAHEILTNILPISKRAQGLLNDVRFVATPQAIALDQIKVPTLAISLEDDYYGTIVPARIIAAKIPGARLITYPSGGHIWIGHDAEVFAAVDGFIGEH